MKSKISSMTKIGIFIKAGRGRLELDWREDLAFMHELPENEPLITSPLQPYNKMNHGMDEGPSSLHCGGGFFEEGDCGRLARSLAPSSFLLLYQSRMTTDLTLAPHLRQIALFIAALPESEGTEGTEPACLRLNDCLRRSKACPRANRGGWGRGRG